jgi:hypothetical protein
MSDQAGPAPSNGTSIADPATATARGIADFSKANATLMVWIVFLALGGGLLTLHYSRVGYLPEIRWDESLSFLFAMSLIGGGLALLYGLLLFFPGVIWSEFMIFDPHLRPLLCYQTKDGVEPCLLHIAKYIGWPFAIFVAIAHGVWMVFNQPVVRAVGIGAGLILALVYFWWNLRQNLSSAPNTEDKTVPPPTHRALLTKHLGAFGVSASISLASLVWISHLEDPAPNSSPPPTAPGWLLLPVICTLVVVLANLLVAVQYRGRRMRALVTSILAAAILLVAGEYLPERSAERVSSRILARFGIGGDNLVTLFIDARGSQSVQHLSLPGQPYVGGLRIDNVQILSRLGSEYFFRVGNCSFTLPKSMVISWQRDERGKR